MTGRLRRTAPEPAPRSSGPAPPRRRREHSAARPLPGPVLARMETAFGADFSEVAVREDDEAAALGAAAFTRGSEIVFHPGAYDPHSPESLEVLAHELAHVLQQRAGRVSAEQTVNDDPALEAEAEQAGKLAARGESVPVAAAEPDGVACAAPVAQAVEWKKLVSRPVEALRRRFRGPGGRRGAAEEVEEPEYPDPMGIPIVGGRPGETAQIPPEIRAELEGMRAPTPEAERLRQEAIRLSNRYVWARGREAKVAALGAYFRVLQQIEPSWTPPDPDEIVGRAAEHGHGEALDDDAFNQAVGGQPEPAPGGGYLARGQAIALHGAPQPGGYLDLGQAIAMHGVPQSGADVDPAQATREQALSNYIKSPGDPPYVQTPAPEPRYVQTPARRPEPDYAQTPARPPEPHYAQTPARRPEPGQPPAAGGGLHPLLRPAAEQARAELHSNLSEATTEGRLMVGGGDWLLGQFDADLDEVAQRAEGQPDEAVRALENEIRALLSRYRRY